MSNRCHVATRKGLFTLDRGASGWSITRVSFLGDNCTLVMHDPRTGHLIAALNHGHFGIKMHRSRDGGATAAVLPQSQRGEIVALGLHSIAETGAYQPLCLGNAGGNDKRYKD